MIPEELKNFRTYSEAELDREMLAYCRQRDEEAAEERANCVARLKQNAKRAPSDGVSSREGASDTPGDIPKDLQRMLDDLASPDGAPIGHVKAPVPTEAMPLAAEPPIPPAPGHGCDTEPTSSPGEPDTTTAAPPMGLDRFPVSNLHEVPAFDDPGRELAALCRALQVHRDYLAVRDLYCQLSIRMNLQGAIAPAFRPRPRVEAPKGADIHMRLHRDRLVIDYHWCHAKRIPLSPTDAGHAHLHDLETDFDFTSAWVLTGRNQTPKYRAAEALCLTPLQQCQTMKLHSQELCERLVRIYGVYRKSKGNTHSPLAKATTAIGKWAERDPRIEPYKVSYEKLWLAQEMLGADGIVQSIAELHALMLGAQPLARKTVADKLKRLTKNVGVALKPTSMP
jgi:hypothetical protein